jgi:dihydrofolate synthase/folylpolyglutamate synthase
MPFIVNQEICKEAIEGIKKSAKITGANVIYSNEKLPDFIENQLCFIQESNNNIEYHFAKLNIINLRAAICLVYHIQKEYKTKYNRNFIIDKNLLNKAIVKTNWPGRFDIRKIYGRNVIFDASHNPDGFKYFLYITLQ